VSSLWLDIGAERRHYNNQIKGGGAPPPKFWAKQQLCPADPRVYGDKSDISVFMSQPWRIANCGNRNFRVVTFAAKP
jgi:hypothetical protein